MTRFLDDIGRGIVAKSAPEGAVATHQFCRSPNTSWDRVFKHYDGEGFYTALCFSTGKVMVVHQDDVRLAPRAT